ncbi:amino acid permease [Rhodococcus rhodnii]|uniref:Gamma-aminobutyrate APC transporter n=2 Tax=Rhodococcus rhodnii TaxID=38312 RepID=R7WNH3_9NOCA|nr:amino acid permease [Rhodococcus rhodnii]EOM76852.1 gamma-aminobutyrate APC transporter [Rhodococcus rhodnii LMG 5362]TXG89781.1 amino acid permease [Rhodococcus rhodnii]
MSTTASTEQTTTAPELRRAMKPRQLVMMSLGGAIGAGLFVGSGAGIGVAGPAVLVSFLVAGFLVVLVMRMMGEMVAADPDSGAFSMHAEKALGRTAGRTIGWLYWVQVVIVIAAEATAAAAITSAAFPEIPQWTAALVFMSALTLVNLTAVARFGEFEFWFAALKIVAIVVFLAIGVAMIAGWFPSFTSPGLSNLTAHGGFAPTGLTGIAAGLLVVVFAFGGTEVVAIAAAESRDPSRSVGKAVRSIVWRILFFYIGSVFVMVTVLPWTAEGLASGPFVAVLDAAHVPGAAAAMTIVIVIALLSSLNAMLFSGSRMIFSLAERGAAPARFAKLARNGVPGSAVLASVTFGFVTVALNYLAPDRVLPLLLNAVGSTILVLWTFVTVSHLILRRRYEREGRELPLRMWAFPYLSYVALGLLGLVVVLALFDTAARGQLIATTTFTAAIAFACWLHDRKTADTPAR